MVSVKSISICAWLRLGAFFVGGIMKKSNEKSEQNKRESIWRNKSSYIDICKGAFGRKAAYTGVSTITVENVLKVVGRSVSVMNYNCSF